MDPFYLKIHKSCKKAPYWQMPFKEQLAKTKDSDQTTAKML